MSDVTIIGLGEMGSVIARTLISKKRSVTVWNRTPSKAEILLAQGGLPASSVVDAIKASPVTIVCVSDYAATREILASDEAAAALSDKLLIQLSSGIPKEARDMADWAGLQGADYIDGAIFAWPRQIGEDAVILISGQPSSMAAAGRLLELLGEIAPTGEEVGASSALFSGALAYLAGHWIGFAHGARVCESEGLNAEMLGEILGRIAPALAEDNRHMGRVVTNGRYARPESTLRTAGNDIARLVKQAEAANLSIEFPAFAAGLFGRAITAGLGAEEHVAIAKLLGPES